jgi:hypothetical protein
MSDDTGAPVHVDEPTHDAIIEELRNPTETPPQGSWLRAYGQLAADFIESRFPVSAEPSPDAARPATLGDERDPRGATHDARGSETGGLAREATAPRPSLSSPPEPSPDVLRSALARIADLAALWRRDEQPNLAAVGDIAREALAASPPAEPTYEWRAAFASSKTKPWFTEPVGECRARDLLRGSIATGHIERRTAPGPWQRVTDEEGRRDG